ncbi:MAG: LamG-like jellyroll fold domain-containing protein [Nostoc sp.]|uniref:LamG-like jellyroll fold domain-containing protein n=1 Tax=Nostoc sp. TaxID=1180 RepID=UPI002FF94759
MFVFYTTPIAFNTNTSFQTQFQSQLTGGTLGGDGFTFVLQNSPAKVSAKGSSGGNLGYGGTVTPITKSLAIKFNTSKNAIDPNKNNIAVLQDGSSIGLLGYWKFDEATGKTVLDSSGNNNKGSLINSSRTVGLYGQALQVSRKNSSYASIPASASLNSMSNQITVSAWARPNGKPVGFEAVVNRQIRTLVHPDQFFLGFGTRNRVTTYKWELGTTNGEGDVYKGLPTADRWVHLVGTYDGSMLRLYVDGVQIGANPVTGNLLVDNNPVTIGAAENYAEGTPLGDRFDGLVDEVRIYNRALSATEIMNLR